MNIEIRVIYALRGLVTAVHFTFLKKLKLVYVVRFCFDSENKFKLDGICLGIDL